jgi:SAM-dependent methyltransferase
MNNAFVIREQCPGCQGENSQKLYAASLVCSPISDYLTAFYAPQGGIDLAAFEGGEYVLMECGGCGLVFQRNVLSDALMCRLYEEWIDPVRSLAIYEAETGVGHVLAQVRQIADLIHFIGRHPAQIKVLDYGMGWGHWCRIAGTFGLDVHGHELSQAKVAQALSQGVKSLTAQDLRLDSFDFINIEQVLEHLPDPLQTLKGLVQSLRSGGLIRIGVPDGWNIKKRLRAANWQASKQDRHNLNPVAPLEHVNCFNHSSLTSMARRAGLEPISVPSRHTLSCIGQIRSLLRPLYYSLRGSPGTTQYFRRSS